MKVMQVINGICHWDASSVYKTAASTKHLFPTDVLFVDAPDYVFEGWGYLDGEFVKPTPPDGWLYNEETGTFYPEWALPPSEMVDADADRDSMLIDLEFRVTLLELGVM